MERDPAIDIAKAIAIILMIIGHSAVITQNWSNWIFCIIFSFHMPLFYIFSGYYFKPRTTKEVVSRGFKKLVLPYIYTGVIAILILLFISHKSALDCAKGLFIGTLGNQNSLITHWPLQAGPIWFLLSLFWCKVYFNVIYNLSKRYYFEISLVLSLIFLYAGKHYFNMPLCIGSGFASLVFYAIGKKLQDVDIKLFIKNNIIPIVIVWVSAIHFTRLNLAQYICEQFPLSIAGAVCGTFAICYTSQFLYSANVCRFLNTIGNYTLVLLCCHTVAFNLKDCISEYICIFNDNILQNDFIYIVLTVFFISLYYMVKRISNHLLPTNK